MKTASRCLLVAVVLVCGLLYSEVRPSVAAAPPPSQRDVMRKADLGTDPQLQARLELPEDRRSLAGLLETVNELTGRALLVLGEGPLPSQAYGELQGKTAREALERLSAAFRCEWHFYDGFYFLFPPDYLRHKARPISRAHRDRRLTRKLTRGSEPGSLRMVIRRVGIDHGTPLLTISPGASEEARKRFGITCNLAASGRTLDELMRAITAMTGDPWERIETAYALCISGEPLSYQQRQAGLPEVSSFLLTQSLSANQKERLKTDEGLRASQLTPAQRHHLAVGTRAIREAHGVGVDQLVLRRSPTNGGGFSSQMYLHVAGRAGPIGSINLP